MDDITATSASDALGASRPNLDAPDIVVSSADSGDHPVGSSQSDLDVPDIGPSSAKSGDRSVGAGRPDLDVPAITPSGANFASHPTGSSQSDLDVPDIAPSSPDSGGHAAHTAHPDLDVLVVGASSANSTGHSVAASQPDLDGPEIAPGSADSGGHPVGSGRPDLDVPAITPSGANFASHPTGSGRSDLDVPDTALSSADSGDHDAHTVRPDLDVLVVGAGPVGLFAACELLRRGLRVRVIDREPEPTRVPRALALWPRALDILADLGIDEELQQASIPITGAEYHSGGDPLAVFLAPEPLQPRHLPQYETERLLTERLHRLGGKVERGVRLLGFDDLDGAGRIEATDRLTSILEHSGGTVERQAASFVIGADGASSTVRGLIGAGFQGSTYELAFALVDARVSEQVPNTLPRNRLLYYQRPTGSLMIAPLPDEVFRILAVLPRRDREEIDVAFMQRVLDERGPGGVTITEPVWRTVYRVHARQASEYQRGRAFLVGDAAHVHSPAGGQGMNNGIQDAYNLAWKLAAVLHGQSPVSLLADYTAERVEATNRIIADTDRQTRAWMANSRPRIALRDAAFRLMQRTGFVPRYVIPVMAGRRVTYQPTRATQSPAGRPACARNRRVPGHLKVGMVFPREAAVALGIHGTAQQPAGWTVVAVAGAVAGDATRAVAGGAIRAASRAVAGDAARAVRGDASGAVTGAAARAVRGDASGAVTGAAARAVGGDASGTVAGAAAGAASMAWLDRIRPFAGAHPAVRTVPMSRQDARRLLGCGVVGFYLIRPDGHIQAHGHENDLAHLSAELELVLPRLQEGDDA
ncbi:FAD-dependent monooxygenase [Actinospica sp. MGRD01-02]|uniref:FAD-dependent monooxygenase n=1 Tax=Actinospica acidithermotolerans TaxID=2828514 RepID=A0A941IN26_9ACTN|nr:FAD-dependent oxidoreductase [Actinospica acidithermotolerans]MBR7830608.1 FAD-dependent monooxygenase [Actinospica acidithermotolerans]